MNRQPSRSVVVEDLTEYSPPADVDTAVVATGSDGANLLLAKQFRLADAEAVIRLNDRANDRAFDGLGVDLVCTATNVGGSLAERYTKQAARHE